MDSIVKYNNLSVNYESIAAFCQSENLTGKYLHNYSGFPFFL